MPQLLFNARAMINSFRIRLLCLLVILIPLFFSTCAPGRNSTTVDQSNSARESTVTYSYQMVNSWPHDKTAFTQGLVFYDGTLVESTGQYGHSSLRRVDLTTGAILQAKHLASEYFAEGLTIFEGKIFQLTWREQKAFVYDPQSFDKVNEFSYQGEGWGLTHDENSLIMSDGSNQLRFLDPKTFAVQKTISVYRNGKPVNRLNELEYIHGEIYANVWGTNKIACIDALSGRLLGVVDLAGLDVDAADRNDPDSVLNGIAYDDKNDRLFVTGKLWSKIFEIRLVVQSS